MFWIAPAIGAFNYTIIGVTVGLVALIAASIVISRDHVPVLLNAASSIILGWLCGLFWPVAVTGAFLWLSVSKRAEPAPDA